MTDHGFVTPAEAALRARLAELEAGRARLMRKLERSLAIRDLWPDAFAHGACTSRLVTVDGGRLVFLEIRDGLGMVRKFSRREIPECLLEGFTSE